MRGFRSHWPTSPTATSTKPMASNSVFGYTSSTPATSSIRRSYSGVFLNSQPWKAPASAMMPTAAVKVTSAIEPQLASSSVLNEPVSSRPVPDGSSTNMKGTRNAGVVYFQHCSVVLYGSPPVIAAAANGDSAVGGDTSDSTAHEDVHTG